MSYNEADRTLRSDYEVIKKTLNNPRLYVSFYCDQLRNRIDLATIELENKLVAESKSTEELYSSHEQIINQVKIFEQECQSELAKEGNNDLIFTDDAQNMINVIEQRTKEIADSKEISLYEDVNRLMEDFIIHIQRKVFLNKGLVFISFDELDSIVTTQAKTNKLVILKDIFVHHGLFSKEE